MVLVSKLTASGTYSLNPLQVEGKVPTEERTASTKTNN